MAYVAATLMLVASLLLCGLVWLLSGAARLHSAIRRRENSETRKYRVSFAISVQMLSLSRKVSVLDDVLVKLGSGPQDGADDGLQPQAAPERDGPTPEDSTQK